MLKEGDYYGGDSALVKIVSTTTVAVCIGSAIYCLAKWMKYSSGSSCPQKVRPVVDLKQQTRILSDGSRLAACHIGEELVETYYDDVRTISDAVRRGLRESVDGRMLGYREKQSDGSVGPYQWLSYKEVIDRSIHIAYGLREIRVQSGQNTFIGILAKNRPEWIICEQAVYNNNSVLVPLYETLGVHAVNYIIQQTSMQIVLVDEVTKAEGLIAKHDQHASIRTIVVMEDVPSALTDQAKIANIDVYSLNELQSIGQNMTNKPPLQLPSSNDLCTIAYTSGTTGKPKGVMLTHGNVIACTTGLHYLQHVPFRVDDVMFSFLPLAHMFERMMETVAFMTGMRIGYYNGDIKTVVDDIKELKPTILPMVPRVLNRIYDKVMNEVKKSLLSRVLFNAALMIKGYDVKRGFVRNDTIVDKTVFKRIRDILGGRVRIIITGSAPAARNVLEFARATMGCVVIEGYGQTECVAECALCIEADTSTGCVGIPVPCNAVKLVDVPELGYFAKNMTGEVCVRGHNVFRGYYKDDAATKETLDSDGWLHTGDIGRWTDVGTLQIIDRKKYIFKLSQGEYVAPEKIEAAYCRSDYVAQVFVYGESLKTCIIGVVVPDEEAIKRLAEELNLKNRSLAEICSNDQVKRRILDDMLSVGKQEGLCSFEQVKDIYVSAESFSLENGLLTPTLKSKRVELKKRFAAQLSQMYAKLQ